MNEMSAIQPDTSVPVVTEPSYANSRMAVMQRLHEGVRLNDLKLPLTAFQPDLLPADLFERPLHDQNELIALASNPIIYEGGLPVVEGRLYWEMLPWEPKEAYSQFTDYRRLVETYGYRSLNLLVIRPERPDDYEPSAADKAAENRQLLELRQNYTYYAWGYRVKAFDMVATVGYDRLRERRAMETENHHYLQLAKIFTKVVNHWDTLLGDSDEAVANWKELGVVDSVKVMKEVMQLQRLAAGLPVAAPLTAKEAGGDPNRGHSMETRLKSHAKQQALLEDNTQSGIIDQNELLKDPKLLAMAQSLILAGQRGLDAEDNAAGVDASDESAQELEDARRAMIVPASSVHPSPGGQDEG